jgi:hypothetical protein
MVEDARVERPLAVNDPEIVEVPTVSVLAVR